MCEKGVDSHLKKGLAIAIGQGREEGVGNSKRRILWGVGGGGMLRGISSAEHHDKGIGKDLKGNPE